MTCRVQAQPKQTRVPSYVQVWKSRVAQHTATTQQAREWLAHHGMTADAIERFFPCWLKVI